jgi:hypothetical protein
MKRIIIILVSIISLNNLVFSEDNDVYRIIERRIYDSIEFKYIHKMSIYIYNIDGISFDIIIEFKTGTIGLKDFFSDIIENEILIGLYDIFKNTDINISTYFPFSIILNKNYDYSLDERQTILNDIYYNTHGITIEHIFMNTIYGYLMDKHFGNSLETADRVNKMIFNNFNILLEILEKHFGIGNIISFL